MLSEKGTFSNLWGYDIGKGWTLILLLTIVLAPVIVLSFYVHPTADDYLYANWVHCLGFFNDMKYQYLHCSGRYADSILISLTPVTFHASLLFRFNTLIYISLFLISAYWLSSKLFPDLNTQSRLGLCALFVFAFFIQMPDMSQGIFWQTFLYSSFTSYVCTFLLLGCIIEYYQPPHKKRYFILSCLLAITVIGITELSLAYIDSTIFVLLLVSIIKKQKITFPLTLFAICIACTLIAVMAPGNYIRGALFPKGHRLLFSLQQAYIFTKDILLHNWLPFMFFMGLLVIDILLKRIPLNERTKSIFSLHPLLVLSGSICIPFIGMFIGFYAEGRYPELRILDLVYFHFIAAMIYFAICCTIRIKIRNPHFRLPVYIKLPVYALLIYTLLFRPSPIKNAYKDLQSGIATAYNNEQNQREGFLLSLKGDSCTVDSIKHKPVSFYFLDIQPDQHQWIDTNLCRYYNIRYIGVK